jgi:hypothetical protein
MRPSIVLVALAALFAQPAAAQVKLYENSLPEGFGYVRFVNTLPGAVELKPSFGDTLKLGAEGADRVTAYHVVENVTNHVQTVAIGQEKVEFTLKPASFNTAILTRDAAGVLQAHVLSEQTMFNQTRAHLSFTNATLDCAGASLVLEPGGQSVFGGVAPLAMKARDVNPIASAKVRAACGTAKIAPLSLGELGAGGQFTVWLMAPAGAPQVFVARDSIAPYLR